MTADIPEKPTGKEVDDDQIVISKSTIIEKPFFQAFKDQMGMMLRKNLVLQWRYIGSTIAMSLLAPFIFALLLFLLQRSDSSNQASYTPNPHPAERPLPGVDRCWGGGGKGSPCVTLMYAIVDPSVPPPDNGSGAALLAGGIPSILAPTTNGTNNTLPTAPGVDYKKVLETFAINNKARTGYQFNFDTAFTSDTQSVKQVYDMVQVPHGDFIYNFTLKNPNTTQWGVVFTNPTPGFPVTNVQYQVWFNDLNTQTSDEIFGPTIVSFIRAMDEAIITVLNDPTATVKANIDISLRDWPTIPPPPVSPNRIIQQLGPAFFFCGQMIIFINVLSQIVAEKEHKLRNAMQVMGLLPSVYWCSHFVAFLGLVIVNALTSTAFGYIFGFQLFTLSNFAVMFITFLLFGCAMVIFAFFLTTFVLKTNSAILIGIFIFILGLLLQSFVFSSVDTGFVFYSDAMITMGWLYVLPLLPFYNFGLLFLQISTITTGRVDEFTGVAFPGTSFTFSSMYNTLPDSLVPSFGQSHVAAVPVPVTFWYFLIMNCIVYAILLWWTDAIVPDEFGARLPLNFFMRADYWGLSSSKATDKSLRDWLIANTVEPEVKKSFFNDGAHQVQKEPVMLQLEGDEDTDVIHARELALNNDYFPAVKIVNLRKVYGKSGFFDKGQRPKTAVRASCFTIEEGKLFALLGQNGAGKSTTISMLAGLTPATSGDALIYNMSVKNQIGSIRKIMGICPQHDVLFDDLTAREHIQLYAGIKGVPHDQIEQLVTERLKAVHLHTVANVRAGTYSGGMKRRLSLVISTIGDPKVIFMDEPTTGMDPVNRRRVWSFIENFKQGRVIILTTHSMEEADVLGDDIAVMSNGRMRALDNSIALKNKHGVGYHVSVVTDLENAERVKEAVLQVVPEIILADDAAGSLFYQLPASSMHKIPDFVAWLEQNEAGLIRSWGISQSTLEEVFLKLIRAANAKFNNIVE